MNRRKFLSIAGVNATVCSLSGLNTLEPNVDESGPPVPDEWTLVFEDHFEGDTVDKSAWDYGWGWGRNTSYSPTRIVEENAYLQEGTLHLRGTHEDREMLGGALNTKNKVTFGPGSFFEARIRFAERDGFQCAFWAKPNSEAWPPEIDVVELIQEGRGQEDVLLSRHHLHYPTSTNPGDSSTHRDVGRTFEPGGVLTECFHVYAVEWRRDRIVHYVNGKPIKEWTDETLLEAMEKGAPFYMMFSLNINEIAGKSLNEEWGETMEVDWVRVWNNGTDSDGSTRYLWVRSADGAPASFSFEASGGNIRLDSAENEPDYWIGKDGLTAGGTVKNRKTLPGFWFDGEITSFSYTGSVETFVDGQYVDPDGLVDQT